MLSYSEKHGLFAGEGACEVRMEIQSDYESELILAVFPALEDAQRGLLRMAEQHVRADGARQLPLLPGRYDLADGTLGEEVSAVVRGAEIGVPAGAVLGLGAAATLLGGSTLEVMAGLAAGGAFVGGVIGALEGAVLRARFDDDAAGVHEVRAGSSEVLLVVHLASADGSAARARRALNAAGALAFLDSTTRQFA
jgi:hypothetical protein